MNTAVIVVAIVSAVIAIFLGILFTVLFFSKEKDGKYAGSMAWFYDFVTFKKTILKYFVIVLKALCRSIYLIGVIFIILGGLLLPITRVIYDAAQPYSDANFWLLLAIPAIWVGGNIAWRLICEFVPVIILFLPKLIRKFFRWCISVPHRPRPYIIKKGDEVENSSDEVLSWKYFKK